MKHSWLLIFIFFVSLSMWHFPEEPAMVYVEQSSPFYITIDGAVTFPKTMVFYEPASLFDIVNFAGGYLDTAQINPSQQLFYDSTTSIFIPFQEAESSDRIEVVNVNKASFEELLRIPGMTETRAAELIVYRTQHGDFSQIDELLEVKYIGQATLENIRPYITTSTD